MDAADGSRVLVVDDEPQITRVLRTVLVSQGYQVRTAAEGRRGAVELPRVEPRARHHRPLHAAHGRHRAVPPHPGRLHGADHRAVGERRGADQGRSARFRRRRLRDEAVRHRRAAGARPGRAAARRRHRGRRPHRSSSATSASISTRAASTRTATRSASRPRNSISSSTWRGGRTAS